MLHKRASSKSLVFLVYQVLTDAQERDENDNEISMFYAVLRNWI